jgi:hypothetical protein
MSRPTEVGLRFTPGMARGMSSEVVEHVFVRRYELPEDQADEVKEIVARRLMEAVHAHEEQGQPFAEMVLAEILELEASHRSGRGSAAPTSEFGRRVGKEILPFIPAARELIQDVVKETRPLLPMKGQLKMGADLLAVDTTMDVFEKNMQKWAEGDVDLSHDPFHEPRKIELNEAGESEDLVRAREQARLVTEELVTKGWDKYVEDAKAYYGFDESQAASADSILREFTERAERLARDEQRQQRAYHVALLQHMIWRVDRGPSRPLRELLDKAYLETQAPLEQLGDELKDRIDNLATHTQRQTAEATIAAALAEKGYKEEPSP